MKARFVDKNGKHFRGLFAVNTFGGCRLNLDDLMHIFGVRLFQAWLFICSMQHLSLDRTKTSSHSPWQKASIPTIYNSWLMAQWTMDSHGHRSWRSISSSTFKPKGAPGSKALAQKRSVDRHQGVRIFFVCWFQAATVHPWRSRKNTKNSQTIQVCFPTCTINIDHLMWVNIHPWRLTWNISMEVWKIIIFGF